MAFGRRKTPAAAPPGGVELDQGERQAIGGDGGTEGTKADSAGTVRAYSHDRQDQGGPDGRQKGQAGAQRRRYYGRRSDRRAWHGVWPQ